MLSPARRRPPTAHEVLASHRHDDSGELFGITELSQAFGVSPRAIRFYEDQGPAEAAPRQRHAHLLAARPRAPGADPAQQGHRRLARRDQALPGPVRRAWRGPGQAAALRARSAPTTAIRRAGAEARAHRRDAGRAAADQRRGATPPRTAMTLANFPSAWMSDEHRMLQDAVARFIAERWVPRAAEFRAAGRMGVDDWRDAAANGLLCSSMPEAYGGAGGDFGHEAVLLLEQSRANISGWGGGLHSAIVAPYILHYGTEEQKRALAAAHVHRRADRRDRDDRARHRQRPAGRAHDRAARRRPLRDQRREDLHHERPAREPRHRRVPDRQRGCARATSR